MPSATLIAQEIKRKVYDRTGEGASVIMQYVRPLISKTEAGEKKVRLLGISISNFDDQETNSGKVCKYRQLPLPFKFPDAKDITQLSGLNEGGKNMV